MTYTPATTFAPQQQGFAANLNAEFALAAEHTKPPAARLMYVDADAGSDSNDGRSWGTAKLTLAAARTALPNGGRILLASSATEYELAGGLDWGGYSVESVCRVPGLTNGLAVVRHTSNGDLFGFGAKGG